MYSSTYRLLSVSQLMFYFSPTTPLKSHSQCAVSRVLLLRKQNQITGLWTDWSRRWQEHQYSWQTSCSTLKSGILSFCSTKYFNYHAYDRGLGSKKAHLRRWENKDVLFHLPFYPHLLFYHISSPLKFYCPPFTAFTIYLGMRCCVATWNIWMCSDEYVEICSYKFL